MKFIFLCVIFLGVCASHATEPVSIKIISPSTSLNYKYIYFLSFKEYILKECLNYNYHKSGNIKYEVDDPIDSSNLSALKGFSIYTSREIREKTIDFIKKNASFYDEDYAYILPLKNEGGNQFTAIFSRCIEFHNSKKADDLIKDLSLYLQR